MSKKLINSKLVKSVGETFIDLQVLLRDVEIFSSPIQQCEWSIVTSHGMIDTPAMGVMYCNIMAFHYCKVETINFSM